MSTLRNHISRQVQRDSARDEENNANSSSKDVERATAKTGKDTGGARILSKPFTARQLHTAAAHGPSKTNSDDGNAENARAGGARAARGGEKEKRGRGTKHRRQVDDSGNFSLTEANGSKRAQLAELSDSDESDSAGTSTVPRVRSESVRGVSTRKEASTGAPRD